MPQTDDNKFCQYLYKKKTVHSENVRQASCMLNNAVSTEKRQMPKGLQICFFKWVKQILPTQRHLKHCVTGNKDITKAGLGKMKVLHNVHFVGCLLQL